MKTTKTALLTLLFGALVIVLLLYVASIGLLGKTQDAGRVSAHPIPAEVLEQQHVRQQAVAPQGSDTQILFGDFHVHSTFSADAYTINLALLGGEGSRPPADACDFARYCSALDFWSINDHAEQLTPSRWRQTIDSIRQCNAVNADPENPDTVAFLGWEWSQMGDRPGNHYGHRNVVLPGVEEDEIPARPIGALQPPELAGDYAKLPVILRALNLLATRDQQALDVGKFFEETVAARENVCPPDLPERDMPKGCMDFAATPAELFARLDDWGFDSIVIPHGTTWGNYTPPLSSWEKQLGPTGHDPQRQFLFEAYSGHGSADVYRPWRAVIQAGNGKVDCPPPGPNYLPSCWQSGEIIRERCIAAGESDPECDTRAKHTRHLYAQRGSAGHLVVPDATEEEWLDAGQCQDCFLPAFNYRPMGSLQYILGLGNFDNPGPPKRFRFGVIGSSDNHSARPGTGYKELNRRQMTDATGLKKGWFNRAKSAPSLTAPDPVDVSVLGVFDRAERDRMSSFFTTGGLVAVHSPGRTRDTIWTSLKRRQVYGTSGDRILLWFDAETGGTSHPMGSELTTNVSPQFQVKAVGAFEQKPGCPDHSRAGLGADRLSALCLNECYNPSDKRKPIARLEIVKILPQIVPAEDIGNLIQDPWLVHECPPDPLGCSLNFNDPDYAEDGRDAVYYVRAIQSVSDAINGDNLRCEFDALGNCIAVNPCHGNEALTEFEDDCLAPVNERAWSSPIFVDWKSWSVPNSQ